MVALIRQPSEAFLLSAQPLVVPNDNLHQLYLCEVGLSSSILLFYFRALSDLSANAHEGRTDQLLLQPPDVTLPIHKFLSTAIAGAIPSVFRLLPGLLFVRSVWLSQYKLSPFGRF